MRYPLSHAVAYGLVSALGATPALAQVTTTAPVPATQVVLLGTGTPNALPERSGTSIAVVVNDTPYIVDVGPGVVRRANAAFQAGVRALRLANLRHAFVTHLHSDHTVGYADLIFTPWGHGRDGPLQVYGPEGIGEMTEHVLAAYREDVRMRVYGLEPINDEGHRVTVHEVGPGIILRDENVTVEAFSVRHGSWPHAFGYRFETPDKTIVISGDAAPSESVVEQCRRCDILLHEVYSQTGFERRTPEWQRYHSQFHTSTHELAEIAQRAQPGLLILYHQLFWGTAEDDLVVEITSRYDGRVVSGKDLEVY